jgi:hypothetical protein
VNKVKALVMVFITAILVTVSGCEAETVTSTVIATKTVAGPTQTVTAVAQTVTVTQTQTVTMTATQTISTTKTTTSPTTTKTSTTTPATTTTIAEFTPVTSVDGKLQVISATLTGIGTGYDASRLSIRGVVQNLSDETLSARITIELFDADGSMGVYTTDALNIAAGGQKNYLVETDLSSAPASFNVTVEVIQ